MHNQFTAAAAILEEVYDAASEEFNTDFAWEVVSALNTEQKVVPTSVSFANTLLHFEPEGKSGKQPPYATIELSEILHFYQFARYDNCVVLAVHGREKPPHYQALAFGDRQTAVSFCDYLRLMVPGNKMPKPPRKPPAKSVKNPVLNNNGLGHDQEVEPSEQAFEEAAWFLENGHPVASRKVQPKRGQRQQEQPGGSWNLADKSTALLSARHLQPSFRDAESTDFAALLQARRERGKAGREPARRNVCAVCTADMQTDICEHCVHRATSERCLRQVKSRNKNLRRREFSTQMFHENPETERTIRLQPMHGYNSHHSRGMQKQRTGQPYNSKRRGESYVTNSVENIPMLSYGTRNRPTRQASNYKAYSQDRTSRRKSAERWHRMNVDWDDDEEKPYRNYTRGQSYHRQRSKERGQKSNGQVFYIWRGDRQEPVWRYSSEESLTTSVSSNSNEYRRFQIRQKPM